MNNMPSKPSAMRYASWEATGRLAEVVEVKEL
jgi:hypothetical protein